MQIMAGNIWVQVYSVFVFCQVRNECRSSYQNASSSMPAKNGIRAMDRISVVAEEVVDPLCASRVDSGFNVLRENTREIMYRARLKGFGQVM